MNGAIGWSHLLWLPETWPSPLVFLIGTTLFVAVLLFPLSFFLGFAERKLTADLQARVGPNRAGPHGLLQAPADLLKELSRVPAHQDSSRRQFWYMIYIGTLYSSLGALPLAGSLIAVKSELSALLPLLSFSLSAFAFSWVGLESYHYEALLSSLRRGYQHWSAIVPALISVLTVGLVAESFDWVAIGELQSGGFLTALVFRQPLLLFTLFVFQLSGMILFGIPPFQSARRGMELLEGGDGIGGFHQFYAFFAWSVLSAVMFLGAWDSFGLFEEGGIRTFIELMSVLLKASVLYLGSRVVARAFPQLRLGQMTDFAWTVLSPMALTVLILCAFFKTLGAAL